MDNLLDDLSPIEQEWRSMQVWLESCGYMLRPRFRIDWVPSWITNPPSAGQGPSWAREDWVCSNARPVIDAIRVNDNIPVMLKKVFRPGASEDDEEEDIALYLSSPELLNDPRNHAVPIYDVLQIPNDDRYDLLVMPLLRKFDSPRFDTIGECMDFLRQIFQGLQFMHHHLIAHRDCTGLNVMMDASDIYPKGFHPRRQDWNIEFTGPAEQRYTRTQRPPKYYWIDFGLAASFSRETESFQIPILRGNDKTVPEHQDPNYMQQFCDPFPTDIYYLGNLVREYFTEGNAEFGYSQKIGLDFIKPLVDDMVQDDPSRRPNIDECVIRLDEIIHAQSSWTLRSQVWHNTDNIFGFLYRLFPHWARRIIYIITQTPPIPQRE